MIADVRTVAWKELREIVVQRGGSKQRRPFVRAAIMPVLIGIFFGLQTACGDYGFAVFPVGLFAMSTASGIVTDAIVGERERHTLETLLASPASDTAILGGKLAATVAYAWCLALVQLTAVEATAIAVGHAIAADLVLIVAVLSFFEAVLAAGFGVQFSLRAPTVRVAARKLGLLVFLLIIPVSLLNVLAVADRAKGYYPYALLAAFLAILAADVGLLLLAKARFRRGRLLLD